MAEMSQQEVKAVCDAAAIAWEKAGKRAKIVRFKHNGEAYSSTLSAFRFFVRNARNEPVACRYF
jgi:hypothetical protein